MKMNIRLIRTIALLFCLNSVVLLAQNSASDADPENKSMYSSIDLLIERATRDIDKAIEAKDLAERVILAGFNFLGNDFYFKSRHREYLLKSIEAIYQENRFFHFVKSIRALNRVVLNESLDGLKFVNPKDQEEIDELTKALGATKYAIVNVNLKKNKLELVIQIKNIERHENLWQGKWSVVWRTSNSFVLVGIHPALSLDLRDFPFLLDVSLGRTFNVLSSKLELVFFFYFGASFINLSNVDDFETRAIFLTGVSLNLDVLEWFKVNYNALEYFLTFRVGLISVSYNFVSLETTALNLIAIGNNFIINADYNVFFEINIVPFIQPTVENNFAFSVGFKYRFEI